MRPPPAAAPVRQAPYDSRVVAHDDRVTETVKVSEAFLTPRLESGIADREDLVEHQHFADGSKGDRVGEASRHPLE